MKPLLIVLTLFFSVQVYSQTGINTTDPKGVLDIVSDDNTGLILPRVSQVELVTDGDGNPPPDGAVVYDISRDSVCFYIDDKWICYSYNANREIIITIV